MLCPECRGEMRLILDEAMGQTYHCLRCDKWVDLSFDEKEGNDTVTGFADTVPEEDKWDSSQD